jgi:hypothetical protein
MGESIQTRSNTHSRHMMSRAAARHIFVSVCDTRDKHDMIEVGDDCFLFDEEFSMIFWAFCDITKVVNERAGHVTLGK